MPHPGCIPLQSQHIHMSRAGHTQPTAIRRPASSVGGQFVGLWHPSDGTLLGGTSTLADLSEYTPRNPVCALHIAYEDPMFNQVTTCVGIVACALLHIPSAQPQNPNTSSTTCHPDSPPHKPLPTHPLQVAQDLIQKLMCGQEASGPGIPLTCCLTCASRNSARTIPESCLLATRSLPVIHGDLRHDPGPNLPPA